MSENKEMLTHTVHFARKASDGNYGTTEAGLFIQFATSIETSADEIIEAAGGAFATGMAIVFDRLGLDYELNEEGNVVEIINVGAAATPARVEKSFAGAPAAQAATETSGATGVGATPPFDRMTKDAGEKNLNKSWAKARHQANPNEFWDNTEKPDWNGPDFTHKDSRVGYWKD